MSKDIGLKASEQPPECAKSTIPVAVFSALKWRTMPKKATMVNSKHNGRYK
jgi:hypothetical protein